MPDPRTDSLLRALDVATRAGKRVDWKRVRLTVEQLVAIAMRLKIVWDRLDRREQERLKRFAEQARRNPRGLTNLDQRERDELLRILRKGFGFRKR